MLVEGNDFSVTLVKGVPTKIKSWVVSEGSTGFYNIYVNAKCSYETIKESVQHEIEHIENDDLYSDKTADEIEQDRQ